jgi:Galactose oxidase, central domain
LHLASAELYDPATETWTGTGNMNRGRDGHTATLLSNGQVLAVGGSRGNFHFAIKTELYDPPSGTWILTHPLLNSNNRKYHTATLLPENLVRVAGGDRGGSIEHRWAI